MIPYKYFIRNFSFNPVLCRSREGRVMGKIMQGVHGGKKKWFNHSGNHPEVFSPTNLSKGGTEGRYSVNSRRVTVLNKLFMRHITDLMATGESSSDFLGRGIEINRVMVTPDFKGVNVFWVAKGTEDDNQLEQLLQKNAGSLRHELSQLRVMGVVPKIYFVKDKQFAKLMEVDLKLAKADFGEDYVPVEPSYRLRTQLCLNAQIPEHIKEKIQAIESEAVEEEFIDAPLPPMRMDVLGLNHAVIMHRVQQQMKKSRGVHRKDLVVNDNESTKNDNPVLFESQRKQKEAFQEFLMKRQISKAKADRLNSKSSFEREYMEVLRQSENEINDYHIISKFMDEDDDYIEETDDNDCSTLK